jgi:hypothetical protein
MQRAFLNLGGVILKSSLIDFPMNAQANKSILQIQTHVLVNLQRKQSASLSQQKPPNDPCAAALPPWRIEEW